MDDLGLYIHIPFCKSKCFYCDFNSYSDMENIQDEYIDSVINEVCSRSSILGSYRIKTVYIGGGTPTYLNLKSFNKLLSFLKLYINSDTEYTCEANPGTLTIEKLSLMKKMGINRLSIGLQSWNNDVLKSLGRIHTVGEFLENYHNARSIGFNNINIDLMFAIQGQTIDNFSNTLDSVIGLSPEHISCYGLIIEEGTRFGDMFASGQLKEIDEETDRVMYYLAIDKLKYSGYSRYEISNYAKPGCESLHNTIYWETKSYLGIGAGAHSFIGNVRFSNEILPEKYISMIKDSQMPVAWQEELTQEQKMSEFMFMGLRMIKGVDLHEFKKRFGIELFSVYESEINELIKKGLIIIQNERLILTDIGIDLSNQVFVEFA